MAALGGNHMTQLRSFVVVLITCVGCSDSENVPESNVEPEPTCTPELVEACLVDQMVCVVAGRGAGCQPCAIGKYASGDGVCSDIPGTPLVHDFPMTHTEAGQEITNMCRSWTLNNPEPIWVHAVELVQDEHSHHSNWMFVPEGNFDGPDDEIWPCADYGYCSNDHCPEQLQAVLMGGIVYAQSTQAAREVQKLPPGAVIKLPANARIISDVHLLNLTESSRDGRSSLTLYTLEEEEVDLAVAPFHLDFEGLAIPPQATSRWTAECDIKPTYESVSGEQMDLEIYYLLPHTHALGTRVFVEIIGGVNDGLSIMDVRGFNSEARGYRYWPPINLSDAQGLRFGCEFQNTTDETVGWGFGDQEMCEVLGFGNSRIAFESNVTENEALGVDGDTQLFTGPCETFGFPWNP